MSITRTLLVSLALAAASFSAPAIAQAAGQVVVVDLERIYGESTAGKSAQSQLQAIENTVAKELEPEGKSLDAEKTALGPKFQNKSQQQVLDELQKDQALRNKYTSFVQRLRVYSQKADQRQEELVRTEQKAVNDVLRAAAPDINAAMTAKGAQIVLARRGHGVVDLAPAVDITADVLTRFNGRVKTVAVTKVDLTPKQQ